MLAAFASFTVAAATALLYLYEDRGLSRRDTGLLRLRLPSLEGLDRLAARASLAGLALLSGGSSSASPGSTSTASTRR